MRDETRRVNKGDEAETVACETMVARRWKVVECEQAEELCKERLDAAKVDQ